MNRRSISWSPWVSWAVVLVAVALALHCGPTRDPRVTKAEETLATVSGQDPQFTVYALGIAARSSSSVSESLIVQHLAATDYQLAYAAAQAAAVRPTEAMRGALQALFDSKGGVVKIEAAVALARLGDEAAHQWLREHAQDSTGAPSAVAIRYLAEVGEDDIVRPILEERLKSEQQEARDEIYRLLGEIGRPWSAQLILEGFKKERGEGRNAAIVALGKVGEADDAPRIERFVNTQGLVFASLEALGNLGNESSAAAVEKMLKREEGAVRAYAAVALWKLGQEDRVKDELAKLFGDDDWKVRLNFAEQLASVDSANALSMLATLAEDPEPKVRVAAVRALRDLAAEGLEAILLERVGDEQYEVASLALDALGAVGTPAAVDAIAPQMDHENGYVALSAANAVLEILTRSGSGIETT